jgi:hypothetical protein
MEQNPNTPAGRRRRLAEENREVGEFMVEAAGRIVKQLARLERVLEDRHRRADVSQVLWLTQDLFTHALMIASGLARAASAGLPARQLLLDVLQALKDHNVTARVLYRQIDGVKHKGSWDAGCEDVGYRLARVAALVQELLAQQGAPPPEEGEQPETQPPERVTIGGVDYGSPPFSHLELLLLEQVKDMEPVDENEVCRNIYGNFLEATLTSLRALVAAVNRRLRGELGLAFEVARLRKPAHHLVLRETRSGRK